MRDDIFDTFNKRIKDMFEKWSFFDDEDFYKDFEEKFEFKSPKDVEKSKNYSISYKYSSDMKEPEIEVKGDASNEEVEKFLEGVQKRFGRHFLGISDKRSDYALPFRTTQNDSSIDVIEGEKETTYTMEMPGIGKEHIKYQIKDNSVEVIGKSGDLEYKKTLFAKFKPKKVEFTANNGIISFTLKK